MSTAQISAPITGDKLYQERAREAFPILVRQAKAGTNIFYSDLAQELGMANPRNLNYVLASIGQTLELLSEKWQEKVPPIQCLVVNKSTGLPGEGVGWFLVKKEDFGSLPLARKKLIVKAELNHIFAYPHWDEVLEVLELKSVEPDFTNEIALASAGFGGGESEAHRVLKEFVARNPKVIGVGDGILAGTTEYSLPSGDRMDVSFSGKSVWIAAEVKSSISSVSDIVRGLFQCVKYQAVMEAVVIAESTVKDVRTLLVLESEFPQALLPLKNLLGIEVVDCVSPK
ncbi:hypothetical protein HX871_32620 [Pseudomonas reactans]|uniref:Uncharacterized protein n=1 Tax=Pseudomonas reactans TaxID=117680 RepID=A0ABX2R8S2_9PSED|nr:hypothetical protein [Pseudomonas reactans]NWA43860.1 hypothetical protein [Pseudomonas reactans]NWC88700.1 hypothetical protein [Pseudomonas reactans]NWD34008.1 hypothetical protein [Pseudomonas reactans]NWD99168.1 hypothetical protein [Pseudomonas reactans]NWF12119.1 hypothetical protein [Pseudomonas reactans]